MTTQGQIVHNEYVSTDLPATVDFFSKMFGWKFQQWDPNYSLFEGPNGTTGGVAKPQPGENPGARNYIMVTNLEATVKQAAGLGAKVILERQEVPNMGAMALVLAPGNVVQGFWEPAPGSP